MDGKRCNFQSRGKFSRLFILLWLLSSPLMQFQKSYKLETDFPCFWTSVSRERVWFMQHNLDSEANSVTRKDIVLPRPICNWIELIRTFLWRVFQMRYKATKNTSNNSVSFCSGYQRTAARCLCFAAQLVLHSVAYTARNPFPAAFTVAEHGTLTQCHPTFAVTLTAVAGRHCSRSERGKWTEDTVWTPLECSVYVGAA